MTDMTGNQRANIPSPAWRFGARLDPLVMLPIFGLLLLAMLWTVVFHHLAEDRNAALKQAASNGETLVRTFEERTIRILRLIDQTSQFLKFEFEHHGANFAFAEYSKRIGMLPTDVALLISIADSEGKPVVTNQPFAANSVADRDYFRVHVARDSDNLYISQPVLGRQSGKWVIVLSRRLNHPDGSFAGTVLLSIETGYLASFVHSSDFGEQGFIGLIGADGVFRSRRLGTKVLPGEQGNFSTWLNSITANQSGATVSDNPFDDVRRLYNTRKLAPFPLTAIVGISEEEVLPKVYAERTEYLLLATAASIGIIAFIALLMWQSYRLRKSERAAKDAHAVLSAAAERSLNAFYILKNVRGPDHRIVDFTFIEINEAGARLFGIPADTSIGQKLGVLLPKERSDGLFDKCVKVVEDGMPVEEEFEIKSGATGTRWVHQQIVPIGDGVAITTRDISDRKYAEMETRNNRAFLQSLIDYLPVLIYARSFRPENHGCTIVWNNAAEAVTGYAASKVIGRTNHASFAPQLAEQFEDLDRRMLADPQVADFPEMPFRRFDGGLRYLRLISVPLFDEQNRVEYILGIAEDITGRRAQELTLRTQQAELAAVNDASPLGLFHIDPDGACTYVNHTYEKMSGLTREQALGDGWAKSIHPEDRLRIFQGWGKLTRTQQLFQGIFRLRHADGRIVWASLKTAPILVDGLNQGYVGSVDDITARREAEQALAKSEQRLRTITDTLPALVAYVDAGEHYRFNNLAYENAFGVDREQIRGKTLREFLGETEYRIIEPNVRRVLRGETVTFESEDQATGSFRCAESTYIPQIAEESKDVVGFHVMIQDITPKKMEERRLLQLAQIDSLTGLVNRAGFEQKLSDAMAHSKAAHTLMAIMYLDIDRFKVINDTRGHLAGDMLLKAFAARLSRALRSVDTVARLGGDEFTVIMEGLARPEDALTVAGKIIQSMQPLFSLDNHPVSASASIGVAYYLGDDINPQALIRRADEMLYEAKAAGRNTFCVAPYVNNLNRAESEGINE